MKVTLKIWRQKDPRVAGKFVSYPMDIESSEMSMLECLDVLNERLIEDGEEPVAFEHDCREGICGSCGFMINGVAHGPKRATTVCQLTMRHFKEGDELVLEPWRAAAFPLIKDLVVDRRSFDRMIASGGYISVSTGNAVDGNTHLIGKDTADRAMDARDRIGEGRIIDVQYGELMREPIATMRTLYKALGDEFTEGAEAGMQAWIDDNPQDKFGRHEYKLGQYGLSVEGLAPLFERYLARYDVEREG